MNSDKTQETAGKSLLKAQSHNPVGRPASIDAKVFAEVIASIEGGLTICAACRKHKVARAPFYRFVATSQEYRDSLNLALEAGPYALLEEIAFRRATRGHVGKGRPSDALLALMLKGQHPRYRDGSAVIAAVNMAAKPAENAEHVAMLMEAERRNAELLERFTPRRDANLEQSQAPLPPTDGGGAV